MDPTSCFGYGVVKLKSVGRLGTLSLHSLYAQSSRLIFRFLLNTWLTDLGTSSAAFSLEEDLMA